ncbi:MAG TPA: YtxH domain-containing protein [Bacillota bacterium]|nr:YtxH domain-containing protein [Bacillota bacterium]
MGKNRLFIGMAAGAILGGLITLFDKPTRDYTKRKLQDASTKTKKAIQNPSEMIQSVQTTFDKYNNTFQSGADSAINALEQVENTVERLSKKRKNN